MRRLRLYLMGAITSALIGALGAAGAIAQIDAIRFADPVGDSIGDTPDIVAASTTATTEGLVLEVELADDWVLPETRLLVWFFPDPTTRFESQEPVPRPDYCNPWFMDMVWIDVTERADLAESFGSGAFVHGAEWPPEALPYSVDGRDLRLTIPLATLGDPETLGLHLRAIGLEDTEEGGDHVPDEIETCLLVPLGGGAMPDDATDEVFTLDGQSRRLGCLRHSTLHLHDAAL